MHTSVVHPEKRACSAWRLRGRAADARRASDARRAADARRATARGPQSPRASPSGKGDGGACDGAVSAWSWHEGRALLPFPFRLWLLERPAETHAGGVGGLVWEAWNRSAVRRYIKLHERKEDERYCDELPCAVPARPEVAPAADGAVRRRRRLGETVLLW